MLFRSTGALIFLFMGFFVTLDLSALTISEVYENALANRFRVREKHLEEQIGNKLQTQVLSNILPKLSVIGSGDWQDEVNRTSPTGVSSEWERTGRLHLEQPLFQGGAEFFGFKSVNADRRRRQYELKQAKLDLYQEVSEIFIAALISKIEKENLEEQQKTLEDQIAFLKRRSQIGRVRQTDVIAAQSQKARALAALIQAEDEYQTSLKKLGWLNGAPVDKALEFEESDLKQTQIPDLKYLADENLAYNPKILAKKEELHAQNHKVFLARAEFLPTLDLDGNYYFYRSGSSSPSDWDLGLTLEWQFFSGFETRAQVSIEQLEAEKLKIELMDLRRRLEADFEAARSSFQNQNKRLLQLQEAHQFAKQNYELQQKDYRLDLVSNFDVLRSLEDFIEVKRLFHRARYENYLAHIHLQLLTGREP